jgi:hypothetical protein
MILPCTAFRRDSSSYKVGLRYLCMMGRVVKFASVGSLVGVEA